MKVKIYKDSEELGDNAARLAEEIINACINEKGYARIALSTGASQFDTIKALINTQIDWSKVEMFHLDEYVGLSEAHPASFRKYLKERFTSRVSLKNAYFVNGEGNAEENIKFLCEEIEKAPIDLGFIGIGENAHLAFNDPPADFNINKPYIIVNLDDNCKKQQVGEGWFATIEDVPKQAISMSINQIMKCNTIFSCVPYKVKAQAIKNTLENEVTNNIPATILKSHKNATIFLDSDSSSLVREEVIKKYSV